MTLYEMKPRNLYFSEMEHINLESFLTAFKQVENDYSCAYCLKLCENPLTLGGCFHIICAAHYDSLKACPKCDTDFDGKTFTYASLDKSIEATKELRNIFELPAQESPKQAEQQSPLPAPQVPDETNKRKLRGKKQNENVDTTIKHKAESKLTLEKKRTAEESTVSAQIPTTRLNKSIEKKNLKGETLLHIACRLGKLERVKKFLDDGANVNTKDNAGWTPLHEVVQNGNLELVRLLLQHNALVNVPGHNNETPLHEAIRYNHEDVVEELVRNGADMNARNCKGESPSDLAHWRMKEVLERALENIIQSQGLNISRISSLQVELDSDEIRVFCDSRLKTVHNKLKALVKHHKNLHKEAKFNKNVTHLVVDSEDNVCAPTLEILQSIVDGLWIINTEWLMKSSEKVLENFEKHEIAGVASPLYHGPKNSRFNKYKQLPGLFDGCHFYFHNFSGKYEISKRLVLTKPILSKLVSDAGGAVLRRVPNPESIPEDEKLIPYHAKKDGKLAICSHYIIFKDFYEPMYNMTHLKALPVGWLMECLERYELCEP